MIETVDRRLIEIVEQKFGKDYILNERSCEMEYVCPFCFKKIGKIKTDRKFSVHVGNDPRKSLKYNCFRCGTRGKLRNFSIKADEEDGHFRRFLFELIKYDEIDPDADEENMFYIPNVKIQKGTVAYNYLISRGFDDDKISFYSLRLGLNNLFGRIIIPNRLFGDNWTDIYQARTYIGDEPKYKNPVGVNKSEIVFNIQNQVKGGDIVIVEGMLTAIAGGKNCVGTFGCSPSKSQIKQILDLNPRSITCCYDNDEAGRRGLEKLLKELKDQFIGELYYVFMPQGKDAADLGETEFKKYVEKNKRVYSKMSFEILNKLF